MNMLNWQYDVADSGSKSGNTVVLSRFWIFWAVALPLTMLTILGWALWWSFEKNRYDIDIAETLRSAEQFGEHSWWRRLARKKHMQSDEGNSRMVSAPVL